MEKGSEKQAAPAKQGESSAAIEEPCDTSR